jgi:ABC-2 type transport system permease protein
VTWLRGYRLFTTWQLEAVLVVMIILIPVQFLVSGLLAVGLGFVVPEIDPETALYLSTGAPTVAILIVGMVVLPNTLSQEKETGAADFYRTLPIPSAVRLASQLTPQLVVAIPGAVLALLVASAYFDFALDPSPLVVVALVAVALTGAAIGILAATVSPGPLVTNMITNVLVFFVMLFSPINFPLERLPDWLQSVHGVLPLKSMAELVRSTLIGAPTAAGDWLFVLGWALGGFVLSASLAARRG